MELIDVSFKCCPGVINMDAIFLGHKKKLIFFLQKLGCAIYRSIDVFIPIFDVDFKLWLFFFVEKTIFYALNVLSCPIYSLQIERR